MSTNESPFIGRIRNVASALLIAIFLALLWLPLLDSFFGLDKAPMPNEKRAPASFPAFDPNWQGLKTFISGVEAYYNDHFGFRKRLIRWHNRWKRALFQESSVADVMVGRDGWLFFSGEHMIENCRAARPFQQQELEAWKRLLERRRDWLAKRGIAYIFVIPPDKHSVYPENLPEWMTRVGKQTRLEQFLDYMKANSTVDVLDLRQPLIAGKKTAPTYLHTDTHWNFFGGFLAYETLIRTLSQQLPELEPVPMSSFKLEHRTQPGGDLAILLGQEQTMVETASIIFTPLPSLPAVQQKPVTNFTKTQKWVRNAEPVFTEVENKKGKAITFRDSFAGAWSQFLAYNFNKVIYIWQYDWDPDFIEQEKPDVVIDEMLERFFNKEKPLVLMEKDGLRD